MEERKIMILGTEYTVKVVKESEDRVLKDFNGYCDYSSKTIIVKDYDGVKDLLAPDNPLVCANSTLRHEIIHAFFYESGLEEYYRDERVVDWIALQFPKMAKLFSEIEIDLVNI